MKNLKYIPILSLLLLISCSTTKYVPEGEYLLNKVTIKTDSKDVSNSGLGEYIQQQPNGNWLFFKKLGLKIYSLSGRDTSKWRNRFIRKLGDPPVIYSPQSMKNTEIQLTRRMENLGFLNAEVSSQAVFNKKKVNLTYLVKANEPYTIRDFTVGITDSTVLPILLNPRFTRLSNIRTGMRFVASDLDRESQLLTDFMRNQGYYNLTKENFYFQVDSALNSHQVDIKLMFRDTRRGASDSIQQNDAFQRFRINSVTVVSGFDQFDADSKSYFNKPDTVRYKGLDIIYGSNRFLRSSIIYYNCFLRPGRFYSDRLLENTYTSLNSMSAVKQASIYFKEVERKDTALLDAFIAIAPANIYYWQTGIDGTNSAGDLGIAGYLTFQNRNIFNGSETFRVKVNGAFEAITTSDMNLLSNDFYEYGAEMSLTFPRFLVPFIPKKYREQTGAGTVFSTGINWQNRPEYNRRFLSLDWRYKWTTLRRRLNHSFDLYNINYVVTPWLSDTFRTYLDKAENAILKESYKDQFITRTNYSFIYTSLPPSRAQNEGYTIRLSTDIAGTLPYLISKTSKVKKEDGVYKLFGIPFAQYFKISTDITRLFLLNPLNIVAAHVGLGVACPYGNSSVVPYEQRFFAGGPNSVRGWSTRTLGPGTYESKGKSDFLNQTGDIKILLNLEYRLKTHLFLEYAAFIDAGNVWTIRDYESQPGGMFQWNSFWKEMGLSWGVGIRPNFGFILLRFDVGMKIYDPEISYGTRWVISHPDLSRDLAFHFAIGYPF